MVDSYTRKDRTNRPTLIAKRSGGGGLMIGMIIVIALIAAIAFLLFEREAREQRRTDAIVAASQSIGDAAEDASKAISDAARRVTPKN